MNISLHKKILIDAVTTVSRFAERKVLALPALSGVALSAKNGEITLRATNLETGIEMKVEGVIKKEGAVAVPSGILRDAVSSFSSEGTVTIEFSGETVVVSTEKGRSTIKTLPYDDIPTITLPEGSKTKYTLSGAIFKSLVASVVNYASTSTVRPELSSVLVNAEGGFLCAVATDSFRLAEKKIAVSGATPSFSILIPSKNAHEIIQQIPDTDITLIIDEHQCAVVWEGVLIISRLVAMNYPDYKQIIPKSFIAQATLLKKDFESALKRTSVFSDSFQKIRFSFTPKNKNITLSSQNSDISEASEEVNASLSGEGVELSFNHRYLIAPLSSITSESIDISAAGIGRPLVIRPSGDTSFLYLVMPMNN